MIKEIKFIESTAKVSIREESEMTQRCWMAGNFYEAQRNGLLGYLYSQLKGINCAVDVGANIGNHSLFMVKVLGCKKVYAIEPHPGNFDHLVENVKINKLTRQIAPINMAVSDRLENGDMTGEGRIVQYKANENGPIKADRLDWILNDRNEKIDYIKIDIEGHELTALKGMSAIFKKDKPIVSIEIMGKTDQIDKFMSGYGYSRQAVRLNHTPTYIYIAK